MLILRLVFLNVDVNCWAYRPDGRLVPILRLVFVNVYVNCWAYRPDARLMPEKGTKEGISIQVLT